MGPIGMQEMVGIFIIALLLFGPKKLPELGKMLGKGLTEFRRAKNELKSTFETHLRELERETNVADELKKPSASSPTPIAASTYHYDESGHYEPNYSSPEPYPQEHASLEPVSSPSSTASATAPQDAEAHRETPSLASSPVAGTVPRSNGVQPGESPSSATFEGHSA